MKAAYSASEVATYLLWRTARERPADPDYLTPLRLQKLLYYVQGWALAELGTPIFADPIEAWRDGPVVRSVYERFRSNSGRPILDAPESPPELDKFTRALVDSVWDRYKQYSSFALSDMTHTEAPWKQARGKKPADEPGGGEISRLDMQREFREKLTRAQKRLARRSAGVRAAARANTRKHAPWLDKPAGDFRSSA